jgi:site-specific recombinase XerD
MWLWRFEIMTTPLKPVDAYLSQLGPGSRTSQLSALVRMARFLSDNEHGADSFPWESMQYEDAARVRAWLGTAVAPTTARRYMSAMRQTLRMCWRLRLIDSEHLARVLDTEPVRGGVENPAGRALRIEELRRLLSVFDVGTWFGARNCAVVAALGWCGLRCVEVCRLRLDDVDDADRLLRVSGKGAKRRDVPFSLTVSSSIESWLEFRGSGPGPLFHGFPSEKTGTFISTSAVSKLVRRAGEKADIAVTPHDLRRSYVTGLLEAGVDFNTVRQLCGHSSMDTTKIYDRRPFDRIRGAIEVLETRGTRPRKPERK